MMDDLLTTRIRYVTRTPLESYTKEFEKKAQEERKLYIDVVEKSVNDIINDEVKSLLPQILPKEVSDFATPVIHSTITKSLENVVLAKSSSQPQSTYETAASLTESREDKDKDEDPPARPDQGSSKGSNSQSQSSGKSAQAEEPVFETVDTEMPQDRGDDMCNTEDQPNVEATPRNDYIIAQAEKTPLTFDELMSTPIDFSAYAMHNLKINNLKHEILIGPAFNLLKGTCKSFVELEYHFEECYKAITDKLDWNNPEGHEYPFDLSKPLPLIEAQGHLVEHADYFFNNDLEYLKGGSSSWKYTTSTTKNKAAKYYNIEGIEDMVPTLWSLVKHDVFSRKRIIAVTYVKVMKWYGYGYLEEIIVQREDQMLHKFKEGDFPRLNLCDIKNLRIVILKRVEDLQLESKIPRKNFNSPSMRLLD
ncbi:hypothetical protein Tco_0845533 [Tanacetum coccineum]